MPLTTETVNILKSVDLFAEASDEVLAEVTALAEEVAVSAGQTIIRRGDVGTSMYIIASGRVRVHIGERTLSYLRQRDVFGEMGLLDSEARVASVTATEDTRLLRLDQEPIYELMRERITFTRGIIRVLAKHLRHRVEDLGQLRSQLEEVIIPLGIALSAEKSLDRLLERILIEAKSICNADAGTIYLITEDDCLSFSIMRTDSLNIAMGGTTGIEIPFPPLCLHDEAGEPNDHNVATHVALNNHSIDIPNIYEAAEFDFSGTKAFDKENDYRSISSFTVPLKDHVGKVIGVLQLFNAQDPETGQAIPFDSYYQLVVESLASQAAVALNTQMLVQRQTQLLKLEHDLQVGRQIQADFLPKELPRAPDWEIAGRFRPAREVAGDFYDAFSLSGERIGLILGDVVDKGVGAALFMALSRSLLRAYAERNQRTPDQMSNATLVGLTVEDIARLSSLPDAESILDAVKLTNDYIARNHADLIMFATVFFAVLEPQSGLLTYLNAGHDPPAIISSSGDIKARIMPTGPAVGMMPDSIFQIERVILEPGDTLMVFTDGVTDARDPNGMLFTKERLAMLWEEPADSASALLDRVEANLRAHIADADQFDDITMLAVRRIPQNGGDAT